MKAQKPYPIHPFAFAIFPILALLAENIGEVEIEVVLRPLAISVLATSFALIVIATLSKNLPRTALVITIFLIAFFSYGHLYEAFKNTMVFGINVGRHRYLFPLGTLLLGVALWWASRKIEQISEATRLLNVIGVALLIYPTFSILRYSLRARSGLERASEFVYAEQALTVSDEAELPDVYYIVLDTYTRADALKNDFGFDNSPFLDTLRSLGFYIVECSRPNYSFTQGSITATLNLNYLSELGPTLAQLGLSEDDIWILLKQSRVRAELEAIGYKTVAFETGYEWSRIRDADFYLALDKDPITVQRLNPFERLLLDSTAFVLYTHRQIQISAEQSSAIKGAAPEGFPYSGFVERQLFILSQIPQLVQIREPTFAFIHLLIPHVPYVFDAQGNVWQDPGFYSHERAEPIDEWHWVVGYTSEIEYINHRMVEIVNHLINESSTPPVIVIQGDHGLREENRLQNLNILYIPGIEPNKLYDTLSPVNSFRLVFNHYFGTDFELLPDLSYSSVEPEPRPETAPECIR